MGSSFCGLLAILSAKHLLDACLLMDIDLCKPAKGKTEAIRVETIVQRHPSEVCSLVVVDW